MRRHPHVIHGAIGVERREVGAPKAANRRIFHFVQRITVVC